MKHPRASHAAARNLRLTDAAERAQRIGPIDRTAAAIASGIVVAVATMLALWLAMPDLSLTPASRPVFVWAPFIAWFCGALAAHRRLAHR